MTTEEKIEKVHRLVRRAVVFIVLLSVSLYGIAYMSRVEDWQNRINGCERTHVRDNLNAKGWGIARNRANSQGQTDYGVDYESLRSEFQALADRDCKLDYPKPSIIG